MSIETLNPPERALVETPPSRLRALSLALVELFVAAAGYIAYSLSTGAVHQHERIAFSHAASVIAFERFFHLLVERQMQAPVLAHTWLVQAFNAVYMWGHLPLIIVVAVWLYATHRSQYRLIRNAVLISGGMALIVFYAYPLAPPRLVPELHLVDTAALISPVYDAVEPKVFFNPYAAIPSMHIGWVLLMGIGIILCARWAPARWFGALLPLAMYLAVVVTGNHFLVDGVAGAFVAMLGLAAAVWLERRRIGYGITSAGRDPILPEG